MKFNPHICLGYKTLEQTREKCCLVPSKQEGIKHKGNAYNFDADDNDFVWRTVFSSHIQATHFASVFAWLQLDCKGQLKFFLAPYPFPLFTPLATTTTVTTPHWYSDATQGCY